MTVGAVILAAGGSRRMGRPKQLLSWGPRTLIRHAAETTLESAVGPVAVVLGAHAARITAGLRGLDLEILENPDWDRGPGTSVRTGAAWARGRGLDAVLFLLADQPFVGVAQLRALVARLAAGPESAAAASHDGEPGSPAAFSASRFAELLGIGDGEGARAVLRAPGASVARLEMPEAAHDLDTPEAYARLAPRACPAGPGTRADV